MAIRLAVPEFELGTNRPGASELIDIFNETLWADLDFSGVLSLVSRSFYPLGRFGRAIDVDTTAWTTPDVDAQFLAFGNGQVAGSEFTVEAHLWDLKTRIQDREAIGLRFRTTTTEASVQMIAHQFADQIIQLLGGGIRGVSQTKIAFVSDRSGEKEIWVMDYDGHNQYQLTTIRNLALTPSWSPDGERIAFTSYERNVPDIAIISRIDRRGFPFPELSGTTTTPSWSPDGSLIAFSSSMNKVRRMNDLELYVADSRGRNIRRLTTSPGVDMSPVWNPRTGREIVFLSDRSGSPQLYTIDAQGGNLRQLVSGGGEAVNPAWSPDGQTIAFAWKRRRSPNFDIYLHDLATNRNVQITQNSQDNERPNWAPDGRHIIFESDRTGTKQVYSMLADGRNPQQLTREGKNEGPAWSPYIGQ
jgi:TolB protein